MSEQGKALVPGTVLGGRYRILEEGTPQDLGTAYRTYDIQQGQQVVVLALAPRWGSGHTALQLLEAVQRAVTSLAAPDLLPYEQVGLAEGHLYVVRARAEDQTLADLQRQGRRMEIGMGVEVATKICDALTPAHRAGLVHGSLSPESVLLGTVPTPSNASEGNVTLIDTGLLPALHAAAADQGRPWGRSLYFSPEQAAGEPVSPASDVYVIGCLLYEMLTGRPPFRASDETVLVLQHLRQEPPSLQGLLPHAPSALAQIVHKALAKEPAARYRNAGQLAHILRAQIGVPGAPLLATPVPQPDLFQDRLVVPPPPPPTQTAGWSSREIYDLEGEVDWSEEPTGVDWLTVGLVVVALIAVLGLIPLWRTVYQRYAGPPPAPATGLHHSIPLEPLESMHAGLGSQTGAWVNLDELAMIWYNAIYTQSPGQPIFRRGDVSCILSQAASSSFGSPAYGSQRQSIVNCEGGSSRFRMGRSPKRVLGPALVVQVQHPNARRQCVVEA